MFDDLEIFLNEVATPEQAALVAEAVLLFERMNDEEWAAPYVQYLALEDQADTNSTLDAILDYTRSRLFQLLEVQGIVFSGETQLASLVLYLKTTLDITNHESFDELQTICEADGSSEELFAELLELKSGVSADTILHELTHVNQAVLPRILIETQAQHPVLLNQDEQMVKQMRATEYRNFVTFSKIAKLRLHYLIQQGLDVNYPLKLYLNMLGGELDQLSPEDAAKEFVCAAYLSSDSHENPRASIQALLEHYITDPDRVTKIDIFVSDLVLKFSASAKV